MHMLDTESFGTTFGPKAQRKHPRITVADMEVTLVPVPLTAIVPATQHIFIGTCLHNILTLFQSHLHFV